MRSKPPVPAAARKPDEGPPGEAAPRVRLHADARIQQILDQALLEFSECGFERARMEAIAQRCGLSKGGLYAHFKGKDELFEALLTRSMVTPDVKAMNLPRPVQPRALATWLVDQIYDALAQPATVTTMRLLIAEGPRVPGLVKLWAERINDPLMALLGEALREATTGQGRQRSVVVREPWLAAAPVLHTLMAQLVLGEHLHIDLPHLRKVHVDLLCELLERMPPAKPAKPAKAVAAPHARRPLRRPAA